MGFFSRLKSFITGGFKNIWTFLEPILVSDAGKLIDQALPIAQGIVAGLATGNMPSADKRAAAVTGLKTALVASGYATASDIASSTLNLIVEMAVSHLNATTPAAK